MTKDNKADRNQTDEKGLLIDQYLRYAQDMVKVYEEEKAKRKQLEEANENLRIEISRRQSVEDALRRSEERFRTIFETAQDCIYIKDRSMRYSHVNPAMEHLLQVSSSEIVGRTDFDLYGPDAGLHLREIDRRILQGEAVEEEYTRPVNGVATTFLETKVPLRDPSGEIIGLCGIARNITDRRRHVAAAQAGGIEYPSAVMKKTLEQARLVAAHGSLVLLLGESGTGKDYMARYIHDHSDRVNGPFFTINCASVSPELAESELFGHEAGAFTSARARKRGLLELAEGGTLFLNEVGELSLQLQAKLLTFLDSRSFTRVGGEKSISVDARLIAATNRDLEKEVEDGRFRRDLFFRLNVLSLPIPPLRERKQDIPILAQQVLDQLGNEIRPDTRPVISPAAMETLKAYDWPGNVRELRNVLERALILSGGSEITSSSLGLKPVSAGWSYAASFPEGQSLNDVVKDLKRSLVIEALRRSGGSRLGAARILGISRNSMNHYLTSLQIEDDKELS